MNPDALMVEARAKIIWGDEPASVHAFLTSNGMSALDADQKIQELVAERNREIRNMGIRGTCIGVVVICVAALGVWYEINHLGRGRHRGGGVIIAGLAGLYGIRRLMDGLLHLVRPQLDARSIPDMTE